MVAPHPLSLLCAILLCLPLALIFTFTTAPLSPTITIANSSSASIIIHRNQFSDRNLFRRASQVDPNPNPNNKVAFMFLTTSPLPFAPLWELFFARAPKNLYNVYIHADPTTANYTGAFRGVFSGRLIPSHRTRRHSPSLTSAARRLLAHALLDDASNAMFALLSPSCVPIRSFGLTYRTLVRARRSSFIEILEKEDGAYERWAARGEEAMVPEVEFREFRIGSQFWVIKRKHAWMIVRDRRVWSKFKLPCVRDDTCYPEEHYFPTLLSMVDRGGCIPCTLTHVDWSGSHGGHPRMYEADEVGPELMWSLRNNTPRYSSSSINSSWPLLFARKFSPASVQKLVSMANDVMFRD